MFNYRMRIQSLIYIAAGRVPIFFTTLIIHGVFLAMNKIQEYIINYKAIVLCYIYKTFIISG